MNMSCYQHQSQFIVTGKIDRKELVGYEANQNEVYEPLVLEDYVDNSVVLARIKAGITQEQLGKC
jgi:hypothetical protein